MSWDFKYVSAACPELTKAEVEVLIDHLQTQILDTTQLQRAVSKSLHVRSFLISTGTERQ